LGDFHRNGSGTIYLHALLKTWPALGVAAKDILIIDEVSDDETYSFYLQEMLPQAEIINMGAHGYGHDQMLILLTFDLPTQRQSQMFFGKAAVCRENSKRRAFQIRWALGSCWSPGRCRSD
jgi:hypothetical protein